MLAADDAHLRCSLVGHDVRQAVAVGDDPFGKQVAHRQLRQAVRASLADGDQFAVQEDADGPLGRDERSRRSRGLRAAICDPCHPAPPFPCRALPIAGMVP